MNLRRTASAALVSLMVASPAWAQHMEPSAGFGSFLDRLNGGQLIGALAVVLIFGTGLVSVLTNGLASIVRAINSSPDDDAVAERLEGLEQRLVRLEQQLATRRDPSDLGPRV
jgi:hypothetical protein